MDHTTAIQSLLMSDPLRYRVLEVVAAPNLPDCWIGAGFVRDAIWDDLHGYGITEPNGDVDVIWYNREMPPENFDRHIEQQLRNTIPGLLWSVKNQARMHLRNGDAPYASTSDAMRHWPETATAVAARLGGCGVIEISAPCGTDDLFELRLRPTRHFSTTKLSIFDERVASKRWIERYPRLSLKRTETTKGTTAIR